MEKQNKELTLLNDKKVKSLLAVASDFQMIAPELYSTPSFNAKGAVLSLALKLKEVKSKTGQLALDFISQENLVQLAQDVISKRIDLAKSQGALIAYGNTVQLQMQYQGNVKRAKELNPHIEDFVFQPIYKGDTLKIITLANGRRDVIDHQTCFENIKTENLIGGYVKALRKDGTVDNTEIWNMQEVNTAWSQSRSGNATHKKFPLKMMRKTLLNSITSYYINISSDEALSDIGAETDYEDKAPQQDVDYGDMLDNSDNLNDFDLDVEPEQIYESEIIEVSEIITEGQQEFDISDEVEEEKPAFKVHYSDWKEQYEPTGDFVMVNGTYDSNTRTCMIKRK